MHPERISYILSKVCFLNAQNPVLVGVSGGPDSLALFHILDRIGYQVIPVHFDHLLRPGSTQDAETLTEILSKMGYLLIRGSQDVGKFACQNGLSTEEAARILRYRFLFEEARRLKAQAVITAHTADDQVETVLMHILRGSGLTGLAGIAYTQLPNAWDDTIPLVRPLLDVWRTEILDYCRENNLAPIIDETNADTTYLRNRIRNRLIPDLETNYNPQVKNALLRLSKTAQSESEIIRDRIEEIWQACCVETGAGYFRFRLDVLQAQTNPVQGQIIRRALKNLAANEEEIGYDVVQKTVDFLPQACMGKEIQLVEGIFATLICEDLLICRSECDNWLKMYPQIHHTEMLDAGKRVQLGGKWTIQAGLPAACSFESNGKFINDTSQAIIDADKLTEPMMVRNALPGERFQPYGMNGQSIKISDFFINEKLPRRVRPAYPVVVCGNEVVWIPGYRLAHSFRITRETKNCLVLHLFGGQAVL